MEKIRKCNLCNSKDFEIYAKRKGQLTNKSFSVVKCKSCGLIFVNPRLSEQENINLYDENYFKGEGFDSTVDYLSILEDFEWMKRIESQAIINKIKVFNKAKDLKILDIGCGTGSFIKEAEKHGYENVTGIEFSKYAAQHAQAYCKAEIIADDFLHNDFKKERFDIVNTTEVIEHLRDPLAFFLKVKQILNKDGLCIISTGNVESAYSKLFSKRWPYLNPEGHLYYFSPATFTQYLRKVGLSYVEFAQLNRAKKRELLKYEDQISSFLLIEGAKNYKSITGLFFKLLNLMPKSITARPITLFTGKYKFPIVMGKDK